MKNSTKEKALEFHRLHQNKKLLILPNIWNPMGAMLLEDIGFPAVATASYAMAWDYGVHDGEHIPLNELLAKFKRITQAVKVPVSVDFEKGYAENDDQLAKNINDLITHGVVGINIEDTDTSGNLLPIKTFAHKIKRIKKVSKEEDVPFFVNARTDAYLQGDALTDKEKLNMSIKRGIAYQEAGADCIYPMFMEDKHHIETMVKELDIPINIKLFPGTINLKTIEEMGVARVSTGPLLFSAAVDSIKNLASELQDYQGINTVSKIDISSNYLNGLLDKNL